MMRKMSRIRGFGGFRTAQKKWVRKAPRGLLPKGPWRARLGRKDGLIRGDRNMWNEVHQEREYVRLGTDKIQINIRYFVNGNPGAVAQALYTLQKAFRQFDQINTLTDPLRGVTRDGMSVGFDGQRYSIKVADRTLNFRHVRIDNGYLWGTNAADLKKVGPSMRILSATDWQYINKDGKVYETHHVPWYHGFASWNDWQIAGAAVGSAVLIVAAAYAGLVAAGGIALQSLMTGSFLAFATLNINLTNVSLFMMGTGAALAAGGSVVWLAGQRFDSAGVTALGKGFAITGFALAMSGMLVAGALSAGTTLATVKASIILGGVGTAGLGAGILVFTSFMDDGVAKEGWQKAGKWMIGIGLVTALGVPAVIGFVATAGWVAVPTLAGIGLAVYFAGRPVIRGLNKIYAAQENILLRGGKLTVMKQSLFTVQNVFRSVLGLRVSRESWFSARLFNDW